MSPKFKTLSEKINMKANQNEDCVRQTGTVKNSVKLKWGCGGFAGEMVNAVMANATYIYSMTLGVSASLLGIALALPRIWDAVADPLMGHISDRTRSRWGRRRPYILIGGLGVGLFSFMIWIPSRDWSETTLLAWFTVCSILYFTFFTVWNIPWQAMGLEMTQDVKERNSVQAMRGWFGAVAAVVTGSVLPLSIYFGDGDTLRGLVPVSFVVACVVTMAAIASAFSKETRLDESTINKEIVEKKTAFFQSTVETFSNPHFLRLCGFCVMFLMGVVLVGPMGNYINAYHVFGALPYEQAMEEVANMVFYAGLVGTIATLCTIPLITVALNRYGKKSTLMAGIVFLTVAHLLNWFCYTPDYPYLQLFLAAINKVALTLPWIVVPSMIADLCSVDEFESGQRREATFAAVFGLSIKVAVTIAVSMSGFLVNAVGIVDAAPQQSPESIYLIRILFTLVPSGFILLGGLFVIRYPIDEAYAENIQRQLALKQKSL